MRSERRGGVRGGGLSPQRSISSANQEERLFDFWFLVPDYRSLIPNRRPGLVPIAANLYVLMKNIATRSK
jgi:hypothetical protein